MGLLCKLSHTVLPILLRLGECQWREKEEEEGALAPEPEHQNQNQKPSAPMNRKHQSNWSMKLTCRHEIGLIQGIERLLSHAPSVSARHPNMGRKAHGTDVRRRTEDGRSKNSQPEARRQK
jgi:hypothetical protein